MAAARLKQVQDLGLLKTMVQMNRFEIVRFGEAGKYCLATNNLNSCHAVVILSKRAAILAHIAPNAPAAIAHQFQSAEHWIKAKIAEVINCFKSNKSFFENQGPGSVVAYGVYRDQPALKDQVTIIAATLKQLVSPIVKIQAYQVLESNQPRGPDKGVVLVEGYKSGAAPVVYIEENKAALPALPEGSAGASSSSSTVSSK